mmetsp:Transcript_29492/g.68672  ORF Transcript_29492/g.68672 Transcript_29492/m.68672 type:complete len:225 (-) Transcript_29492:93-767(-)
MLLCELPGRHLHGTGQHPHLEVVHELPAGAESHLANFLVQRCSAFSKRGLEELNGAPCRETAILVVVEVEVRLHQLQRISQQDAVAEVVEANVFLAQLALDRSKGPPLQTILRGSLCTRGVRASPAALAIAVKAVPVARRYVGSPRPKPFCHETCHCATSLMDMNKQRRLPIHSCRSVAAVSQGGVVLGHELHGMGRGNEKKESQEERRCAAHAVKLLRGWSSL